MVLSVGGVCGSLSSICDIYPPNLQWWCQYNDTEVFDVKVRSLICNNTNTIELNSYAKSKQNSSQTFDDKIFNFFF